MKSSFIATISVADAEYWVRKSDVENVFGDTPLRLKRARVRQLALRISRARKAAIKIKWRD